jgi:hypothetical protein
VHLISNPTPNAVNVEKIAHFSECAAPRAAVAADSAACDAQLLTIFEAWPQLSADIKSAILVLVRAGGAQA